MSRAERCPLKPNPACAQLGPIPCLPLLGFLLLCHLGLAAFTPGVLPAPACPHHRCLPPTAEPCSLPLDEGDCQHYTLRWYYNQRVTECRPFVYSGCQGNLNRFDSKEECELHYLWGDWRFPPCTALQLTHLSAAHLSLIWEGSPVPPGLLGKP
uniref:BPTI/Kunitz inhibitor domain-containing protein n=1 Tax=Athene cunicularia TaxID=194338 RepID=A0A663M5I1_ATHCN